MVFLLGSVLALPGLLMATYYLHLFDDAQWFYEFRALPYSELTAGGAGLLAGFLYRRSSRWRVPLRTIGMAAFPCALALGLLVPYLKPIILPVDWNLFRDRWSEGVCIQSTSASCGPACVATLLRVAGHQVTERQIARECYTYARGTENWYMVRALERRGVPATIVVNDAAALQLQPPCVAGVRLGGARGAGHFVAVIERTRDGYVIGDPLRGRLIIGEPESTSAYYFTGFFIKVTAAIPPG